MFWEQEFEPVEVEKKLITKKEYEKIVEQREQNQGFIKKIMESEDSEETKE